MHYIWISRVCCPSWIIRMIYIETEVFYRETHLLFKFIENVLKVAKMAVQYLAPYTTVIFMASAISIEFTQFDCPSLKMLNVRQVVQRRR